MRRAEEGANILGVFRVKNHYFTPKYYNFYNYGGGARKMLGYFVWKITILRQKTYFFPILGGGARRVRPPPPPPPWIRPWRWVFKLHLSSAIILKQQLWSYVTFQIHKDPPVHWSVDHLHALNAKNQYYVTEIKQLKAPSVVSYDCKIIYFVKSVFIIFSIRERAQIKI